MTRFRHSGFAKLIPRLQPRRARRKGRGPDGEEGEPALVEPNRPLPLQGGAAAPLEEEGA